MSNRALLEGEHGVGEAVVHHTYFGPRDTPLFGALTMPENLRVSGGVLLCGSLGKEGMDSVRFERILARSLANRGLAVLRFDYLGTGDSAGDQLDDHAVAGWRRSVQHAADYLLSIGAPSLSVIALRAGSLIVDDALANADLPIDQLVYIDPVGTGRRYLREQAALFQVAVGDDTTDAAALSIIGAQFSRHTVDDFSRLVLGTGSRNVADQLAVIRAGETDPKVIKYAESDGVTTLSTHGLAEFAQPADMIFPMPLHIVGPVTTWLHDRQPTRRATLTPHYQSSAVMSVDTEFGPHAVVETIERIEPQGLFAIRTRPAVESSSDADVVLFCSTSNDSHLGPTRQWVELSRTLAAGGVDAVRWDRPSLGESGPVSDRQWLQIVTVKGTAIAISAGRHAAKDSRRLHVVGVCSGAWYAAQIGRALRTKSVVLVNTITWSWWPMLEWRRQRIARNAMLAQIGPDVTPPSPQAREGTRAVVIQKVRAALKAVARFQYMPRLIRGAMATAGLAQGPEIILRALARGRTTAAIILCQKDAAMFAGTGGLSAVNRLEDALSPPTLHAPVPGDHAAYHSAIREVIRNTVIDLALTPAPLDIGRRGA